MHPDGISWEIQGPEMGTPERCQGNASLMGFPSDLSDITLLYGSEGFNKSPWNSCVPLELFRTSRQYSTEGFNKSPWNSCVPLELFSTSRQYSTDGFKEECLQLSRERGPLLKYCRVYAIIFITTYKFTYSYIYKYYIYNIYNDLYAYIYMRIFITYIYIFFL